MDIKFSISIRSYNELDDNIRLVRSINKAYIYATADQNIQLEVNWFDNSDNLIQSELNSFLKNTLLTKIALNFIPGNNNEFSYWRSSEKAIKSASTEYVLILSGHCLLRQNFFTEVTKKLDSITADCIIVPTAINPYHFPAIEEYVYILLFNNKIFLNYIDQFPNRYLASYPFSNSNAIYKVDSLYAYPMPHIEGNEDTVWMKSYPCTYSVLTSSAVLHSHKPQRQLALRRFQIKSRLRKETYLKLLLDYFLKLIAYILFLPCYLISSNLNALFIRNKRKTRDN